MDSEAVAEAPRAPWYIRYGVVALLVVGVVLVGGVEDPIVSVARIVGFVLVLGFMPLLVLVRTPVGDRERVLVRGAAVGVVLLACDVLVPLPPILYSMTAGVGVALLAGTAATALVLAAASALRRSEPARATPTTHRAATLLAACALSLLIGIGCAALALHSARSAAVEFAEAMASRDETIFLKETLPPPGVRIDAAAIGPAEPSAGGIGFDWSVRVGTSRRELGVVVAPTLVPPGWGVVRSFESW
jgi:hypothetical protein